MAEEKQDGQKTIVAFIVGLLIGGMLVWAFSGSHSEAPKHDDENHEGEETEMMEETEEMASEEETEAAPQQAELPVGDGSVSVNDQAAGDVVVLDSATYPVSEGWIGVRDYQNGQLGLILGVARFSESQGLVPSEVTLLRSTTPGETYAVVIFTEDGDFDFNLSGDVQIDEIFTTFTAQ